MEKRPYYVMIQSCGKARQAGQRTPERNGRQREKHQSLRRGNRDRRATTTSKKAPERFSADNFEHVFYVNPEDIVQQINTEQKEI